MFRDWVSDVLDEALHFSRNLGLCGECPNGLGQEHMSILETNSCTPGEVAEISSLWTLS